MATEESELWAQTIFTITPQENGTFREISEGTKISGSSDTDFQLDTNNIILLKHIRSSKKHFLDPTELKEEPYADAECQTYIQNVNQIHIPLEFIDEATQTFYIGKQCLASKVFENVIVAINKKLTSMKIGQISQTIITFDKDYPMHIIIQHLFVDVTAKHKDPDILISANEEEISKIEAWHSLNHVIERVFWISDPKEPILKTTEAESQTLIACDFRSGKAVLEQETQTGLTCKPKASNSELLSDYLKMKDLVKSCLEDCLAKGVYHRIVVDDILDEVLNKCSQEIHFPSMDNASQTVACCKILEDRDEDVVRKLRLLVVVDPLESSIVLVPLIDELLRRASAQVSEDAVAVVENIICNLIKKAVLIVFNIEEQRKQTDKSMDHIFIQRKRKIALSMRQKPETDTASTQTIIAGVPEVEKLKEPLDFPCSVCARGSDCRWCFGSQEDVNLQKEVKILKTQDILLAYRPCYTQTAPAKVKDTILFIPKAGKKISSDTCSKSSISKTTSSESCKKSATSADSVERVLCRETSPSGWSHVDLPPSKIWSIEDCRHDKSTKKISSKSAGKLSPTNICKTSSKCPSKSSSKSQSKSSSKSQSKSSSKSQSNLPPQAATALQILKSAFCTRETCPSKDESAEIGASTFAEGNYEVLGPSVESKKKSKTSSKVISSFRKLTID